MEAHEAPTAGLFSLRHARGVLYSSRLSSEPPARPAPFAPHSPVAFPTQALGCPAGCVHSCPAFLTGHCPTECSTQGLSLLPLSWVTSHPSWAPATDPLDPCRRVLINEQRMEILQLEGWAPLQHTGLPTSSCYECLPPFIRSRNGEGQWCVCGGQWRMLQESGRLRTGGPAGQVHPGGCGGTAAQPLQVLAEAPLAAALPTGHLAGWVWHQQCQTPLTDSGVCQLQAGSCCPPAPVGAVKLGLAYTGASVREPAQMGPWALGCPHVC